MGQPLHYHAVKRQLSGESSGGNRSRDTEQEAQGTRVGLIKQVTAEAGLWTCSL